MDLLSFTEASRPINVVYVGPHINDKSHFSLKGSKYEIPRDTVQVESIRSAVKGMSVKYAEYIKNSDLYIFVVPEAIEGFYLWRSGTNAGLPLIEFLDKLLQD